VYYQGMKLVLLVLPVFGGLRCANPPYVVQISGA
jgi:hypothetical protein